MADSLNYRKMAAMKKECGKSMPAKEKGEGPGFVLFLSFFTSL